MISKVKLLLWITYIVVGIGALVSRRFGFIDVGTTVSILGITTVAAPVFLGLAALVRKGGPKMEKD